MNPITIAVIIIGSILLMNFADTIFIASWTAILKLAFAAFCVWFVVALVITCFKWLQGLKFKSKIDPLESTGKESKPH